MLSADEISQRLKVAVEAVEQVDLTDDLRAIAFSRALDAVGLPEAPIVEPAEKPSLDESERRSGEDSGRHADGRLVAKIAHRVGVETDTVSRVFEESDGEIRLILKRSMLPQPQQKATSMRNVSLLVVVGRQAAGIEEYTPYELMREECRELRVLDAPNFATEVGKLDFRTRGGRNTKEARANRHHFDEAAELIRQITERTQS
jgi:hypothetical protein